MASRRDRDAGLDVLKAVAIVLVPLEHAHRPFFAPDRPLWEHVVGNAASAVTPVFLFASGVLHARAVAAAAARAARRAPADPEDGGEGEGDGRAALLAAGDDGGLQEALAAAVALRRRTLVRLMVPYLAVACTLGLTDPGGARRRSLPERCLRVLLFKARGPYYYINIAAFTALLLPSIARLSLRAPAALLAAALLARLACVAAYPGEPFVTPLLLPRYLCFYVVGWEYAARWAADGGWADARRRRAVAVCLACALALPPVMLRRQYESTSAPVQVAVDAVRHCGFMAASIAVMEAAAAASSAAAPLAVRMLSDLSYTVYLYVPRARRGRRLPPLRHGGAERPLRVPQRDCEPGARASA